MPKKKNGYDSYPLRFINNDYDIPMNYHNSQSTGNTLPFFKKYSFHIFVILFFEVPTWSARFSHPKVTSL